jgi:dTDP-4-amino-4,6-dideoxygalactose transaminase
MEQIPVFKPLIEQAEIQAAVESLELGWLGMGAYVGQFEEALKLFIGAEDRHVVAVNTGHSALHLAMMLIGLEPGDEVITPSFNNIADFQAIMAVGGKPVLCDIREDTLCIDIAKAEALVGPRTKAVIAMDYDCCLADHDAVAGFAKRHNLRVIHDAAHSLGSFYNGKKVGSFSDVCMFSFDPVKTITCIDGGALVVRSQEEVEALHEMRLIGMGQPASVMYGNQRAWTYDVKRLGFRYHMANLHGAIGLSQLAKMPEITSSRQAACKLYNELLAPISEVQTPNATFKDVTPFLYYIRVPAEKRQPLRDHLKSNGIDTGIHWQPGHWFSLLKDARRGDLSVTDRIGHEILSLPLHSKMALPVVEHIVNKISEFFRGTAG